VAGPYTGKDPRETQCNVDRAISIGCQLIAMGYAPFIPHLSHYVWLHPDGNFDYGVWTALDFEWLKVCDAFFYISPSKGADAELAVANTMGIPIYRKLDQVPSVKGEDKK
jgi:hypothetical protein